MPASSAISWSEVRRPEDAISEAAERRISVRRVPSAKPSPASAARAPTPFTAARRFGATRRLILQASRGSSTKGSHDRSGDPRMKVTVQNIDPELRLAGIAARAFMRPSERLFRLARRLDGRMHGSDVPGLECEQRWVDSLDEGVRVRVRTYRRPARSTGAGLPGVLFLHGGGYVFGSPEQFAPVYRMLLQTRDCVVVAPDYRKSFEAPY